MAEQMPRFSRKPKDFNDWMFYVLVWGLLAPAILAAVTIAVASVVLSYWRPDSELPKWLSGALGTISFVAYYPVAFKLKWQAWLRSTKKATNAKQLGKTNAAFGSIAAEVKGGKGNTFNFYASPSTVQASNERRPKAKGPVTITNAEQKVSQSETAPYSDLPPRQRDLVVRLSEAFTTGHYQQSFLASPSAMFGSEVSIQVEGTNGNPPLRMDDFGEPDLHSLRDAGYLTLVSKQHPFEHGQIIYTGTLTAKALSSFRQIKKA